MSSGLYGDIELKKSVGLSDPLTSGFLNESKICYASGSAIVVVDITDLHRKNVIKNANGGVTESVEGNANSADGTNAGQRLLGLPVSPDYPHSIFLVADSKITALTAYHRENVIAYASSDSRAIQVCSWPSGEAIGPEEGVLLSENDANIQSLAFSFDGDYLVSLGNFPTFQIIVWDWRKNTQVCSVSNGFEADQISFNPLDSTELCTSGKNGKIQFWKIKLGLRQSTLEVLNRGDDCLDNGLSESQSSRGPYSKLRLEMNDFKVTPLMHVWLPDKHVLSFCSLNNQLVKFNPGTGKCTLPFDVPQLGPQEERIVEETEGDADFIPMNSNGLNLSRLSNVRSIIPFQKNLLVVAKNGVIWDISHSGSVKRQINDFEGIDVKSVTVSPEYKILLVESSSGLLFSYDINGGEINIHSSSASRNVKFMEFLRLSELIVTANAQNRLTFWDMNTLEVVRNEKIPGNITCLAANPSVSIVAVGTDAGFVRLYYVDGDPDQGIMLLARNRVHSAPVASLSFDSSGRFLASASDDGHVFIYSTDKDFGPIGYVSIEGHVQSTSWIWEEDEENLSLHLFALTRDSEGKNSYVYRIGVPQDKDLRSHVNESFQFASGIFTCNIFKISDLLLDIAPLPLNVNQGKMSFFSISSDRCLKYYSAPSLVNKANASNRFSASDAFLLGHPVQTHEDHQKVGARLALSISKDWLFTWCTDGMVSIRTLIEPDKPLHFTAHDPLVGGITAFVATPDCRRMFTVGFDGILRLWEWKYSPMGKRMALEATNAVEGLLEEQKALHDEYTQNVVEYLAGNPSLHDIDDDSKEDLLVGAVKPLVEGDGTPLEEKDLVSAQLRAKAQVILEKISTAMKINETLPPLERLDREEFIIDFKERDRLLAIADEKINKVRSEIEAENQKKRVICKRIKKECWDSMEVVGQSVKSFHVDPLTSRIIDVPNYPIRIRSKRELQTIAKIKRLRKVQILVNHLSIKKGTVKETSLDSNAANPPEIDMDKIWTASNKSLLYDPFTLVCNERRRIQVLILQEYVLELKAEFNIKCKDMSRIKQEEIAKIEEKNERIQSILTELDAKEAIYHPELDDDEVPERVVTVRDDEVKAERYLTAEEQKKHEERLRLEKERLLSEQEDNYRARALMDMMNGKLDDRTETEEKEVLIRPEWMDKPKEELNEDERRLVKEFEKKMAIYKEEQEKYRKALETELRKIQGTIQEICNAFDTRLKDFFDLKTLHDQLIYQNELRAILLTSTCIHTEGDEKKELELQKKIEFLKSEKNRLMVDIPDAKKELERCREEYDQVSKKDKDLEKQFKKEFHIYEQHFDILLRLFRRRKMETLNEGDGGMFTDDNGSPFADHEETLIVNEIIDPLILETDLPEGVSTDVWNKLVDFRDRKIASERDVKTFLKKLNDAQTLVSLVSEESDQVRVESEKALKDYEKFQEYKFQNSFNVENLFVVKQGQVEVPQAPMVTDYKDALFVNRSVVEIFNNHILRLGKSKVDALIEMKNYRKGIHSLEWENKMLDFQSEDLVVKIRDIQLLRVSKQMQEFLRNGDDQKQTNEIAQLEKRSEYGAKAHERKLEEKEKSLRFIDKKIKDKKRENIEMDNKLKELENAVKERKDIYDSAPTKKGPKSSNPLKDIYTRRRLIDLAKSQAQDIAILREEVERLRLRTFPAFHAS